MKDYSEFIGDEYGFITKINPIIENKKIEVTTSMSKPGKPIIFELNTKNINNLYRRLEEQYRLLIENKDIILKEIQKKRKHKEIMIAGIIMTAISAIALIATIVLSAYNPLICLAFLPGAIVELVNAISIARSQKSFYDMIETYNYFITNRKSIETIAKKDNNLTQNITSRGMTNLKKAKIY